MAKRRKSTTTATRVVRIPAARSAAPIIKVSAPRAAPVKRKRSRRRSGGGVGGGLTSGLSQTMSIAVGGALYGFAVKSGWVAKLPAVPLIGRTGTAALLLDYWGRRGGGQMVRNAAIAAAALAGYQLGSEGVITGEHFATAGYDGYGDEVEPEAYDATDAG